MIARGGSFAALSAAALAASWLAAPFTPIAAAQQAAFTAKVESVRVDVLALDGGRPILGLKPSDIRYVAVSRPERRAVRAFPTAPSCRAD